MEYHLDRKVILNDNPEFKNLYSWSLQEIDADGKKVGNDQVPWPHALYFTATELVLQDKLSVRSDREPQSEKPVVTAREVIQASLRPGDARDSEGGPTYSMFGTDRMISNFELIIERVETDDEGCQAWGSVSYTMDFDFRDETTDDTLVFQLCVRPDTFSRYAEKIAASAIDAAVLRVHSVAGLYSAWSPSISTHAVKVLSQYEEQEVGAPEGCDMVPPRLGKVGEADLYVHRISDLRRASAEGADEDEDDEAVVQSATVEPSSRAAAIDVQAVGLLSSLRAAAWFTVALLVLILVLYPR